MKKYIAAMAMVLMLAGSAVAFDSLDVYRWGQGDWETTMAVAGVQITKGQWVVIADNTVVAARSCDTAAVVTLIATENAGPCLGVSTSAADTGVLFTVQTRGWCDYAKVDGVDSGVAGALPVRTPLAIAPKLGYAGAASGLVTGGAAPVGTQLIGFLLEPVTARANAAAFSDTATSYAVYVQCR